MSRFTIRAYSDFGMVPQDQTRILFESDNLQAVKEFIKDYFTIEDYFNSVYFIDNKLNRSGYVGRDLTINCGESLSDFCEIQDTKLKKIKDLTDFERREICDKHVYDKCAGCPFMLEARNNGQDSDVVVKYCVHHILNVLEREVEV